uniref:Uncharacterized protein n=1 Tax=Arundo donax TaxID=35708 RepID=A0A0A8Z0A0_ARUDO
MRSSADDKQNCTHECTSFSKLHVSEENQLSRIIA